MFDWKPVEMPPEVAEKWELLYEANMEDGFHVYAGVTKPHDEVPGYDTPQKGALAVFELDTPMGRIKLSDEVLGVGEDMDWEQCQVLVQEFWDHMAEARKNVTGALKEVNSLFAEIGL